MTTQWKRIAGPCGMQRDALPGMASTSLIEPINRRSMPGYFLDDVDAAAELVAALRAEGFGNLKLQFDIFHSQILHGDVTTRLARLLPIVGHVQVASVPARHEPGTGEVNDAFGLRRTRPARIFGLGRVRVQSAWPNRGWARLAEHPCGRTSPDLAP